MLYDLRPRKRNNGDSKTRAKRLVGFDTVPRIIRGVSQAIAIGSRFGRVLSDTKVISPQPKTGQNRAN